MPRTDRARRSRLEADIARFEGSRAALRLLVQQAEGFGISLADVGLDPQLDLDHDLLLDPPPGRFAG